MDVPAKAPAADYFLAADQLLDVSKPHISVARGMSFVYWHSNKV